MKRLSRVEIFEVRMDVFFDGVESRVINAAQLFNDSNIREISKEIVEFLKGNEPLGYEEAKSAQRRFVLFYKKLVYLLNVNTCDKLNCFCRNSEKLLNKKTDYDRLYEQILESLMELYSCVPKKQTEYNSLLIDRCKRYIQKNLYNDITLDDVANEAGVHPNYLSKLFKEVTGTNFIKYVTFEKMIRAKKMLEQPSVRVNEIADRLNYADRSHFCKVFKKNVGVSPTEYRRLMADNTFM